MNFYLFYFIDAAQRYTITLFIYTILLWYNGVIAVFRVCVYNM